MKETSPLLKRLEYLRDLVLDPDTLNKKRAEKISEEFSAPLRSTRYDNRSDIPQKIQITYRSQRAKEVPVPGERKKALYDDDDRSSSEPAVKLNLNFKSAKASG